MTAPPATESIWKELSRDLRRFIRRRVADEHLADDLLQETFVRIHLHLSMLRDADRLPAWVYRIARNVIHDHHRRLPDELAPLREPPPAPEPEDSRIACGSADWLEVFIAQLPQRYRDAVRLSEHEGLSQLEIADRLGLTLSGAKSRVQRGRRQLRAALEKCCRFEFDRRGNLLEIEPRSGGAECSGCGTFLPSTTGRELVQIQESRGRTEV
jgi:RNA polymerase sigma-70 factor, ECF subfamily